MFKGKKEKVMKSELKKTITQVFKLKSWTVEYWSSDYREKYYSVCIKYTSDDERKLETVVREDFETKDEAFEFLNNELEGAYENAVED